MIELRVVASDADYEAWAAIKTAVVPNEPTTAQLVRAGDEDGRLLLLASLDGADVGCGVAGRSSFGERAFMAARVLEEYRRRGVGTELVRALSEHAHALGRVGVNAFVYADEPHSIGFAERLRLVEVDYQLEQRRAIAAREPAPVPPGGVALEPLGARREELLEEVWPLALEGYEDMPVPGGVTYRLEVWLREEATQPAGSFVAREGGELVGYAGLLEHAEAAVAEHGLTVVRRDRRGRGIGRALKLAQIHWASGSGLRELRTWTQKGNEPMQALNRSLGYVDRARVLTMQGPLP